MESEAIGLHAQQQRMGWPPKNLPTALRPLVPYPVPHLPRPLKVSLRKGEARRPSGSRKMGNRRWGYPLLQQWCPPGCCQCRRNQSKVSRLKGGRESLRTLKRSKKKLTRLQCGLGHALTNPSYPFCNRWGIGGRATVGRDGYPKGYSAPARSCGLGSCSGRGREAGLPLSVGVERSISQLRWEVGKRGGEKEGKPRNEPAQAIAVAPSGTTGRGNEGVSPGTAKANLRPSFLLPSSRKGASCTMNGGHC